MSPNTGLNVTIVGGGIAGLFAARVLREKHNVTVLERASRLNEVGASVSPGPNATQFLRKYGFNAENTGAMSVERLITRNKQDEELDIRSVTALKKKFGSDWFSVHRVDLITELHRLATAPSKELGLSGNPATFRWSASVTHVDVESGDVTLEDGSVLHSDLIIGADGIRSTIRPYVTGQQTQPRRSGTSMFRFVLPRADVENTPWSYLIENKDINVTITDHKKEGEENYDDRNIICYPCRNNTLLNVACMAPTETMELETEASWVTPGEVKDLMRVFGDFKMAPLLAKAQNIKLWCLCDIDPLPTYFHSRTLLIGDAAHAMTPHQAQGASQAIEDGEGLSLFIDRDVNRDNITDVLRDFDSVRRTRASKVQGYTRMTHGNTGGEKAWEGARYNMCYGGIKDALEKLERGEEI